MKRILTLALLLGAASAANGEIYTWKDARGTVFYTNSLNEIPARYLRKAKQLDVATGKKVAIGGTPAAAQPPVPPVPPVPGQAPAPTPPPSATQALPLPAAANGIIPPAPAVTTLPQPPRGGTLRRMHNRRRSGVPEE